MSKIKKGKYFFGSVKVGERGQIVIPIEARKTFKINPGDKLLVLGDVKKGIVLAKASLLKNLAAKLFEAYGEDFEAEEKE
jgi:AbrB family looped-hinge helix DNA binding protein